jgi:hypothetical protein
MGLFNRTKKIANHPGNPNYFKGVEPGHTPRPPGSRSNMNYARKEGTLSHGFEEDDVSHFTLHYGLRQQPDQGGALNYAYELYGLPLDNVCGSWMVARHPTRPLGSQPLAFFQLAPVTSIGGLVPGQFISQPLLNPDDPGSGFDIYS